MITGTTTRGSDRITGTRASERLEGADGDDTIIGGGGADTLVGDDGDDRLIARDAVGITGLRGGDGNDFLSATLRGSGQVHMFGMNGDDTIEMDLTKDADSFSGGERISYMGHHAYGGAGADTFSFTNAGAARGLIVGRIDDFNASEDRIVVDGQAVDLMRPTPGLKVFEYDDQQWLKIGAHAYYALEGARDGGAERHFLDAGATAEMLIASRATPAPFVDQANAVPTGLIGRIASLFNRVTFVGSANDADFAGTDGDDLVTDTRVRSILQPEDLTSNRFNGAEGDDVISAGKGDDTLRGGAGNDSLAGGMDRDLIYGQTGDDLILGGSEDDRVFGGLGTDEIEGGRGNDVLRGEAGDDVMRGQAGRDDLWGGEGNDRMSGGDNGDRMFGGAGNDRLYGNDGRDILRGGAGRDTLWGGDGDDRLDGGGWNDRLHGQAGNDVMTGGHGRDTLRGGDGNDWINGGIGADQVYGDAGADRFIFTPRDLADAGSAGADADAQLLLLDRIEDFEIGQDRITFSGWQGRAGIDSLDGRMVAVDDRTYTEVTLTETGDRLLVGLGSGQDWSDLRAADAFAFV